MGNSKSIFPELVFGSTSLGNLFVQPTDLEKHQLVKAWFDSMPGPIAIDTAGKYGAGLALEVLGRELNRLEITSDRVIISNKLGWRRAPLVGSGPTFESDVWIGLEHDAVQDISYAGIHRCWEEGCQLLGGFLPQMLSVHDPDEYLAAATDSHDRNRRLDDILGAYQALYQLRDEGHAKYIGIGCKDWRVVAELDKLCKFDWVMLANSFTIMSHPRELIDLMDSLADRGIPIVNSAVLHGGFLSGGEHCDYRRLVPTNPEDAIRLKWRELFIQTCKDEGVSPFDIAVAFGRSHKGIVGIALSTSRADRVDSLMQASTKVVPAGTWQKFWDVGLIDAEAMEIVCAMS